MYIYIKTHLDSIVKFISMNNIDYLFVNDDYTIYNDGRLPKNNKSTKLIEKNGYLLLDEEESDFESMYYYFIPIDIYEKLRTNINNLSNNLLTDCKAFLLYKEFTNKINIKNMNPIKNDEIIDLINKVIITNENLIIKCKENIQLL